MVGRGYLKPDLSKLRHDTPKGLQTILERCIKYSRDDRLEFNQVIIYFTFYKFVNKYLYIFFKFQVLTADCGWVLTVDECFASWNILADFLARISNSLRI